MYAESEEYQTRVYDANMLISNALKQYNKPYLSFSGGKDSTVMMGLVLLQMPDIMVLHWDYGRFYIPDALRGEIKANAKAMGVDLRIETSPKYEELGRNAVNVLGNEMMKKLIPSLAEEGYDCVFVGLRSEESAKRKRRISAERSITIINEVWPVRAWTWMDIWAYIVANDIPYLSHYDVYGPMVGWNLARFTTLFDPEFDRLGCSSVDGILSWRFRNVK